MPPQKTVESEEYLRPPSPLNANEPDRAPLPKSLYQYTSSESTLQDSDRSSVTSLEIPWTLMPPPTALKRPPTPTKMIRNCPGPGIVHDLTDQLPSSVYPPHTLFDEWPAPLEYGLG
jgi:hypothetical protein